MAAAKSYIKYIAFALAAFMLAFALSGCGSKDLTKEFVGNWKCVSEFENGVESTSFIDMLAEQDLAITVTLNEDKTGSLDAAGAKGTISYSPKSETEASFTLTVEENGQSGEGVFAIKDGKLFWSDNGDINESFVLEKVAS